MGLKINNYEVKEFGITLPNAYAQISSLSINLNGKVNCVFEIQQDRDSIGKNKCFETKMFTCEINKDLPIYEQVYVAAKEQLFAGWTDDIIEIEKDTTEE